MYPPDILAEFDAFLAWKGLRLDAVVIGGAALSRMGVTGRHTRDCDVLEPILTAQIEAASVEFAQQQRERGTDLSDDWLNNGPRDLVDVLPEGWRARLEELRRGKALVLRTLGRDDLLCTKLFAPCDRGLDLADCVALAPSREELTAIAPWVAERDAHPGWPAHVRNTLDDLSRRLGHGV